MKQRRSDPTIDEIRAIRRRISAEHGHDPAKLVAYYIELQKKFEDRLLETDKQTLPKDQSAA